MNHRRVGVVLHDFSLGGTERIAVRLANAWAEAGTAVSLFCGNEDGPIRAMVSGGVDIVAAPVPLDRGRGKRLLLGKQAAAHFHRDPVDLVWVPGNYHWPIIPALRQIAQDRRPRIVAQVSAALIKPQRGRLRQVGYNCRMRHFLRGADEVVTLAGAARRDARAILGHDRVVHIPLPALDAFTLPPRAAPNGPPIILGAGRLVPEKGFSNLIRAFACIADKEASLVIAGDGPERQYLLALAETLGVANRLTMPGYVENIRPLLDRAKLFVLSSDYEGYPAVLVEALAAGRPVVATDCTPATVDLLSEDGLGRVTPIGDVPAMAAAIDAMLEAAAPDPARLAATVNQHRIDSIAQVYLSLFDDVCARPTPRPSRIGLRIPRLSPVPPREVAA